MVLKVKKGLRYMQKKSLTVFKEHEAGFRYKVERSIRKSIQISVIADDENYVIVKAPFRVSNALIEKELGLHRKWITKRINENRKDFLDAKIQGTIDEKELLRLKKEAKAYIPERVSYYAQIMGIKYNKVIIRAQNTRWGSCSTKGNLNFNCLLMLTPKEVIDSVIVHELAHCIHMDHSKAFYDEIYKYYPEYKKWNRWLKEHGKSILLRKKMGENNNSDES